MNKKTYNQLFQALSVFAFLLGIMLIIILTISFSQESGGRYIEVWAKNYSSLIAALGVLVAAGLASLSAHKAIQNVIDVEKQKRKYQSSLDVENIVMLLMNIKMSAEYFNQVLSKNLIALESSDPHVMKTVLLSFCAELNASVSVEIDSLTHVQVPREIAKVRRDMLFHAVFALKNNLRKIKVSTKLVLTMQMTQERDIQIIKDLLVETIELADQPKK